MGEPAVAWWFEKLAGSGRIGSTRGIHAVDSRLVDALRANARASYAELARQVGLTAPSVHERVGRPAPTERWPIRAR